MMGFRLPPPAPSLVVGLRPIFDDSGCRPCSPSGGAFRRHAGWAPEAPFVLWAARAFKRHAGWAPEALFVLWAARAFKRHAAWAPEAVLSGVSTGSVDV